MSDGTEGCLDLIIESADSVNPLVLDGDRIIPSNMVHRHTVELAPTFHIDDASPERHPLRPAAVRGYQNAHGVEEEEAERSLRRLLRDLLLIGGVQKSSAKPGTFLLTNSGFELAIAAHGVVGYRSTRPDAATWEDLADAADEPEGADVAAPVADEPDAPKASVLTSSVIEPPAAPPPVAESEPVSGSGQLPLIDQLERLAALHREGMLTAAEFSKAKSRLFA